MTLSLYRLVTQNYLEMKRLLLGLVYIYSGGFGLYLNFLIILVSFPALFLFILKFLLRYIYIILPRDVLLLGILSS